jgi:hypothetical protein
MAHGLDVCEVSMSISFIPMEPWLGSVTGSESDTAIKMMAHIAHTSLCESHLAATAALPIVLLPIRNQENPKWQQHLEAMSDLKGPTSVLGCLRWPSMRSTCSTCSITPPRPHAAAYVVARTRGASHRRFTRAREAEARECRTPQRYTSAFGFRSRVEGRVSSP